MIEIPDLEDMATYSTSENGHSGHDLDEEKEQLILIDINKSVDIPYNSISATNGSSYPPDEEEEWEDNGEIYDNDGPQEMSTSININPEEYQVRPLESQMSSTQHVITNANEEAHGLNISFYKPELEPKETLMLTTPYDVNPQVVEFNTAEAIPVRAIGDGINPVDVGDSEPMMEASEVHMNSKLQDPPRIHEKSYSNQSYSEDDAPNTPKNLLKDYTFNSNNALNRQLTSPVSQLPQYVGPSPQLPPPLSLTSMQRLTMSNGEEFRSIRRGLATDLKTPAEYTLHIIFTQFVCHAERMLNLCLEYPLTEEPPIVDLLSEGADTEFDQVIVSLGYTARKKPKPVIDSVMFWRKSKSEVASMAASEVERALDTAKVNLSKFSSTQNSPTNPNVVKGSTSNEKAKRSFSLIRSSSISKIAMGHHRHQSTSAISNKSRSPNVEQARQFEQELDEQRAFYNERISKVQETAIHADRKSLASIYILCRVLIEVVKQASNEVLGEDLGDKLEEIVYSQLKTTDPIRTSESLIRSANWNLFAELLGFMSEKRFLSVSDRFIADLEKVPTNVNPSDIPRLHLLISGMRYLKLTNYPLEVFEESADFILSLAKFFEKAGDESIIFAYCEVLSNLLIPLANILTAETNHPTWIAALQKIFGKATQIWNQVNKSSIASSGEGSKSGWAHALRLQTAALSVSNKELFSSVWFSIIEDNLFKLKPKSDIDGRTTYIICITRLLWVYTYRLPDTLNNTIRKLDNLFNLLFFSSSAVSKKNQWINADPYLLSSLVEFIRVIGYQHLNYVLDNVLIKLLSISFNGSSLDNLIPEKMILIVKSYLLILEDHEIGKEPDFPLNDVTGSSMIQPSTDDKKKRKSEVGFEDVKRSDFLFNAKNANNAASHEELCRSFAVLLKLLDSEYGSDVLLTEANGLSTPISMNTSKSQSPFSAFHFGIDFSYLASKDLHVQLFSTLIDAIPYTMVPLSSDNSTVAGIQFKTVVEILTRNAINPNFAIANVAISALKRLASRKNPSSLITIFAKVAFQFSDKPTPIYNTDYCNSPEFQRLLKIYVDLLNCWLKQFNRDSSGNLDSSAVKSVDDELMNKDVLNDLYQINYTGDDLISSTTKAKPAEEIEWKSIITIIEEVEGNGLFFLCSHDSQTRHFGISILKLVEKFDQAIYNITDNPHNRLISPSGSNQTSKTHSRSSSKFAADVGTRLIHILEDSDFVELIRPYRKELSVPERSRLSKLKTKKGILVKIAESDHGIDSTIWFRLFPKLLDIFFEKCPMPVAMCRSIVCVRLVQMHELVHEFSTYSKTYTTSLFSRSTNSTPPEILVIQWKVYLIFACCSLTSTNEQKISFPSQPTHGRKRSMQMFIQHQKITSAKSVFRMVLPFLRSQQQMVRDAVISGLSCININIFRTLLENLPPSLNDWNTDKRRDPAEDRLRVEIIHILNNITKRFAKNTSIYSDEWMVANLVSIIKNVKAFLSNPSIQVNIDFQRLRRFFCVFLENVFSGLQETPNWNKWLPFEARIGCFNFLKEWCGYGEGSDIAEDRYEAMLKHVTHRKDAPSAVAILEIERKALLFASLSSMANLCAGPLKQLIEVPGSVAVMSFDITALMSWIHSLLSAESDKVHEYGKIALKNVLSLNFKNEIIYLDVLKQCYTTQRYATTTENYFTTFVDAFLEQGKLDRIHYDLFCLTSFLVGHDSYEIRFSAMNLLKHLEKELYGDTQVENFTESVCSKTKVVYKKALYDISVLLASNHPEASIYKISYFTKYFNLVGSDSRGDIFSCLLPWMQKVELKDRESSENEKQNSKQPETINKLKPESIMVLNNLFEITVRFSSKISNEVEAFWVALGNSNNNFDKIIEYLISNCLERKNPLFVEYSRQIIDYLTFSQPDPLYIIDKFINNLQPKLMVPPLPHSVATSYDSFPEFPYIADLWSIIPFNEKDAAFSVGQLSMIFLVDLFTTRNDKMIERLPLLLHVSFSLLDHYILVVQEQAGAMLIHLIQSLAPHEPKSLDTIKALRQRDNFKNLWVYDDLNNDKKGARTPRNMDVLARNILEIFSPVLPSLQDEWGRMSLNWATSCAVRHIACRSFQLFRSLLSFLDQSMLKDMLHRLSNTISDETLDIQGFAMQILMTLNAITAELDSEKLIDFPQLFWSSVACLSTIHEQEYIEVLSTMSKFVSKIDLDSPDTVSCLIATFPPKWEGKFEGLPQVIMVGLRSSTSWEPTMKFFDKLNHLKDSEIIGKGDSRLMLAVIANLPRFLHSLDNRTVSKDVADTALAISKLADNNNKPDLSRILVSLAKNRFRSKKDFLVQSILTIKNLFFPQYEAQVLVLLLGFLSNSKPWIKLETMSLLKYIFPLVDLQRDEFVGVGADLISPLLRLLLTDFAEPALEVLDEAVIISGSQLDKDVLRMSLGDKSMKKEYEKTATLFGIPDENGWAIPMPAITAASTRNNVHAVFSTCAVPTYVDENDEEGKDEEIQFHLDDYYAPVTDYADTVSVSIDEPDASLSNMWAALDDFDSFFTRDSDPNGVNAIPTLKSARHDGSHFQDMSHNIHHPGGADAMPKMDPVPVVYDKKASLILNRSLARTESNTSFKTSLADSIGTSNVASNVSPAHARRSYIPFRHSKSNLKNKFEIPNAPLSPGATVYEHHNVSLLSKSHIATPALSSIYGSPSIAPIDFGQESRPLPLTMTEHSMFDHFLVGNKRKSKRGPRSSPNGSTSSLSPELAVQNQNWNNGKQSSLAGHSVNSPPNSAPGGYVSTPKLKDKKRVSQKFR
ncbi:uncharacterized protein PRCAT00001952001 [Priceomyces carsonii]|uniref:uncharacterized protein n=1 Tax=Priceomyces carsonii TaxID=28549 RepID=UPI002EDA2256|nr:unnamed protein product [Priceomyces carsonii]